MYNPAEVDGDGTAVGVEPSWGEVKYIAEPCLSAQMVSLRRRSPT
jgi:hypothetical protein